METLTYPHHSIDDAGVAWVEETNTKIAQELARDSAN
ncbi:MAG: hypothetical protein M2R45_00639 [Verrucomicrobia subdivision 3 bacterium]|nr:hypothetical protein [Limisphaerales bacterium]MCS1414478.1 hypothetical protein [Limisphaerales bacterium]